MIVLVSKYDKVAGKPVTVRRDITSDEIKEMLAEENPGAIIACGEYDGFRGYGDRIRAYAPARCRASEPITQRISTREATLAFRGTVIICGVRDGEECSIDNYIPADDEDGRIEPIYKDDAICIPSRDEWLAVPEEIRCTLAGGMWCWSRTIDNEGVANTIGACGDRGFYPIKLDSGGVVAFIRLPCLPEDVAQAIRDKTDSDGLVCFESYHKCKGREPECGVPYFVKVTNDVYGIGAFNRFPTSARRGPEDLTRIDEDARKTYHDSSLRAELNGSYLITMIKYIRTFIKEEN